MLYGWDGGWAGLILENPRQCVSPPSGAAAVTAPVCPVFRVVVAGRYLVCVDSTDPFSKEHPYPMEHPSILDAVA